VKFTNHFLAHLQVAVHRRFKKAGGFFLTGTVTNADGKDVTVSHWLNRFAPLEFEYDIRDDNGDRIAPVELDPKERSRRSWTPWTGPAGCMTPPMCG
jgi:hypothetical protein